MNSVIDLRRACLPHLQTTVIEHAGIEQWELHGQAFDQRLALSPLGEKQVIVAAFDGYIVIEEPLERVFGLLEHFDASEMRPMIGRLGLLRTPEFVSFADGFDFPVDVRRGPLRRRFVFEEFCPGADSC